jgi:hypothetical protein
MLKKRVKPLSTAEAVKPTSQAWSILKGSIVSYATEAKIAAFRDT